MAKKCIELQLAAIFQNPSDMDYSPMGEKPDLFLCRDFVGEALNVNRLGTPQSITLQVSTAPCKGWKWVFYRNGFWSQSEDRQDRMIYARMDSWLIDLCLNDNKDLSSPVKLYYRITELSKS